MLTTFYTLSVVGSVLLRTSAEYSRRGSLGVAARVTSANKTRRLVVGIGALVRVGTARVSSIVRVGVIAGTVTRGTAGVSSIVRVVVLVGIVTRGSRVVGIARGGEGTYSTAVVVASSSSSTSLLSKPYI